MNTEAATARLSIMVTPATKRRLEAEAQAKKTTVSELVRRRIDDEPNELDRIFSELLADWSRRTEAVLTSADATYAELERDRAAWPKREAEIRKATLASLTETDRAALAELFPLSTAR